MSLGQTIDAKPGATPARLPLAVALPPEDRAAVRQRACDAVEWLMALVDAIDGDADLEPSLGSLDAGWQLRAGASPLDQRYWAYGGDQGERELDYEREREDYYSGQIGPQGVQP